MDQITQQNAAMVEETTAAVRELVSQTESVVVQVDRFRTRSDRSASAVAEWSRDAELDAGGHDAPEPRPAVRKDRKAAPQKLARAAGGRGRQGHDDGWEEF